MAEDLVDHRRVCEGGDDLQGTATVGAVLHVDIEDSFEQLGPAHARWFSPSLGVIGRGFGSALWRSGNDLTAQLRVGRQHTVEAACPEPVEGDQMETRARYQSRQAFHGLPRLHDDMGGAVFVWALQLRWALAGAVTLETFVGDGRPGDIAAELLQFCTLIGAPAHRRMEAKAVEFGA